MTCRIIIMGAAGRDFHVLNCCYRENPDVEVVAFTATQIPHIDDRRYPAELAGSAYADGIPICPEEELDALLSGGQIDEVVFAYSDVHFDYVDARRKIVEAHGVRFSLFDVDATMLPSSKPVIAVTATRTGCGKSQVSRRITHILLKWASDPWRFGTRCPTVTSQRRPCSGLRRTRISINTSARSRSAKSTSHIFATALSSTRAPTTRLSWSRLNRKRMSLSGMAAITTRHSINRIFGLRSQTHSAQGHELDYFPGTENFARADIRADQQSRPGRALAGIETVD